MSALAAAAALLMFLVQLIVELVGGHVGFDFVLAGFVGLALWALLHSLGR